MSTGVNLVIGANGQIGSALVQSLIAEYGEQNVVASDITSPAEENARFVRLDATNAAAIREVIQRYDVRRIFHLAAVLSAKGEQDPMRTWDLNMQSYFTILEVARASGVRQIFFPSSIAVFGEHVSHDNTGQWTCLVPVTVYGISKVAGENWSEYYYNKYGMDIRSLRYPGIISHQSLPGGGTTDYAVEVYHRAVRALDYTCYLGPDTTLPMIYIDDAIRATIELMETPADSISVRTSYNLAGMSFSPRELEASVARIFPDFHVEYAPDFRQHIADSWPRSIDDSCARHDWNWKPSFTLDSMTDEMVKRLVQGQKVAPAQAD